MKKKHFYSFLLHHKATCRRANDWHFVINNAAAGNESSFMWMSYKQVDNQKNMKTEDHQRTWNIHDRDNNAISTLEFDGAFTLFDIEYRYIYKMSTDPMEICVGARMCIALTHPFLFRGKKVCVSTIHIRGAILIHSHNSIQAIFSFMCLCVNLCWAIWTHH